MRITSPMFEHGGKIPQLYTCEGEDYSPPLEFHDVPEEAQSLVLIVEDPDAPSEEPLVHWVVFNIPPDTSDFDEDHIVEGAIEGLSNRNIFGYQGPCPPDREHRYIFRLFALSKLLRLTEESDKAAVVKAMEGSVLAEASIIGVYERENINQKFVQN